LIKIVLNKIFNSFCKNCIGRGLISFLVLMFLLIEYSCAQNCPNLNNNNNNPNFSAQVYVFDENLELFDSVGCSVAGNSGNFNCESIADNHIYVYINGDDTCFYNSNGLSINNPLPIELLSFKGRDRNQYNELIWQTATERNNDYFTLEYSADGVNWITIATVNGVGNSNAKLTYTLKDYHFKRKNVNYYRLTQTDYDGISKTFPIISVNNLANDRKIVSKHNLLGQEVDASYKGLVIQVYNDGTSEKVIQ
jgi:hypothetical protein